MNKAIVVGTCTLLGLLGVIAAFRYMPLPETAIPEEEKAAQLQTLKLMQTPPLERSGRNAWPLLMTWGQPSLTPAQRNALADDYVVQVERWHTTYVAEYLADTYSQESEPLFEPSEPPACTNLLCSMTRQARHWYDHLTDKFDKPQPLPIPQPNFSTAQPLPSLHDSALCGFGTPLADCLATLREQPQAISETLAPYAAMIEQVAELSEYDHYRSPLPQHFSVPVPIAWTYLRLPLTVHALAHIKGDSQTALAGLCRDANSARMLLRNTHDLIVVMVARLMLVRNVELAAQIIAKLPLDAPIPEPCNSAFARLSAEEVSLCPAMRGEFAAMQAFMELEKQRLERNRTPIGRERPSDWQNAILLEAQRKSALCLPQTDQALLTDEKFAMPSAPASTWLAKCRGGNAACAVSQISGFDPAKYAHRMQDAAAYVQMMQVLLWLRQYPVRLGSAGARGVLPVVGCAAPVFHAADDPA